MKKLEGCPKCDAEYLGEMADGIMLTRECEKVADTIDAMGRGLIPYCEKEWNAQIARWHALKAALDQKLDMGAMN
jgi:hypothetical protein